MLTRPRVSCWNNNKTDGRWGCLAIFASSAAALSKHSTREAQLRETQLACLRKENTGRQETTTTGPEALIREARPSSSPYFRRRRRWITWKLMQIKSLTKSFLSLFIHHIFTVIVISWSVAGQWIWFTPDRSLVFFSFLICSARQKKFYLLVLLIGFAAQHKHVRRSSWRIIRLGTCRWSLLIRWKGRNNRRGYQLRNDSVRDA